MGKKKSFDVTVTHNPGTCDVRMSIKRNSKTSSVTHPGYENHAVDLEDGLSQPKNTSTEIEIDDPPDYHETSAYRPDLSGATKDIDSSVNLSKENIISKSSESTDDIVESSQKEKSTARWSVVGAVMGTRHFLSRCLHDHHQLVHRTLGALLLIAYFVYFAFAIYYGWSGGSDYCEGIRFLFLVTVIAVGGALYFCVLKRFYGATLNKFVVVPVQQVLDTVWTKNYFRWLVYLLLVASVVIFLVIDSANNRQRLISAMGAIIFIIFGFLFSKHPDKVIWRQVFWGLGLQFAFALLILRLEAGRAIFQCLGNKISQFLEFTNSGSGFVFGYLVTGVLKDWDVPSTPNDTLTNATATFLPFDGKLPVQFAVFAFKVLPVIFFFSFCISILYYYGIMQWIVTKLGWVLQVTVGTTAAESVSAAANIFVGQTEAPLIIRPYLPLMTKSELHAVMTGGFATIAGAVLAAYINFGVSASHLLSASVMSAPAALGFSKLFYPETEETRTSAENIKIDKGPERNAIEAAANGAASAIFLVANIVANLIAFIAFIAFLNFIIGWVAGLVGYDFVSFEWILSKFFMPLAYIMGVSWNECESVAKLIGLKTVVNEFVAYAELAQMIKRGELSSRAEAIATYALCGFSNLSAIGVQIGGIGSIAPERRSDLAELSVRALIAGSVACFLTACVAGSLIV